MLDTQLWSRGRAGLGKQRETPARPAAPRVARLPVLPPGPLVNHAAFPKQADKNIPAVTSSLLMDYEVFILTDLFFLLYTLFQL